MSICKIEFKKDKVNISGNLDVVWNHRVGEPIDVIGFNVSVEQEGDVISFDSSASRIGNTLISKILEEILGDTLINIARNHCEQEPPTDGTSNEQFDHTEMLKDFYPPRPGH